ncbi:MAG: UDP-galactopyranose mutase [Firmicutes bacterium]|nr:UDP-galactopyranose mutase [Bacillota bacterium]
MKTDWLIVGAGFTGCTLAERIASVLDRRVLIVERRDHIGGNAYDFLNHYGLIIHKYGPHIFHTDSRKVWDYLSRFTNWRSYEHHVLAEVEGQKIPLPFNLNSLRVLFPTKHADRLEDLLIGTYGYGVKVPILKLFEATVGDLRELANYIHEWIFSGYTKKQWGLETKELDPSVLERVPVFICRDNRYFQDPYQGVPEAGYTDMFRRMVVHPRIKLLLGYDYHDIWKDIQFDNLVYTGSIDSFFSNIHGELPFRSLRFDFNTLEQEFYQEVATVNYPNRFDFTRITEQKYITGQVVPKTTLITEYPQRYMPGHNEPFYPIPRVENEKVYQLYKQEAKKLKGSVIFAGRLADYRYYDMDDAVARALSVFEEEVLTRL